jgi:hypothetical protein
VFPRHELLRVDERIGELARGTRQDRGLGFIGFEDFEAAQLLVDHGQGLESFRLEHLLIEPIFDLVLSLLGEFLVDVVDVSVEL